MTPPILNLVKGSKTLNLNDLSKYFLTADFVPPAVNRIPNFAEGSSANRYGGASLVSTRSVNRAFSFTVQIRGNSDREMQRAMNDIEYMLSQAGDQVEPLYLKYKANSDVAYEPLWGQDGWMTYIIEHGIAAPMPSYSNVNRRAVNLEAQLNLSIRPYALGKRQRLGSAIGGVFEDTIGASDNQSRGLVVSETTTNKMTNPIFGYSTWNNAWTAGADIVASQNTDSNFVLFGDNSAKLTSVSAVTDRRFYQSINVGNTNTHVLSVYAKLSDSSAISSAQILLLYNTTIAAGSTTYTPVGNGWYRISGSVTGINASTSTGVLVINPYTIFIDGIQLEEKAYITPLVYGDMVGCAWTSTVHSSTSTRTAAHVSVVGTDSINLGQGTFRIAVKFDVSNTHPNIMMLFETSPSKLRLYFSASDDKFYFEDGTNTATTAAQTFSVGTIIIIHATYMPGIGLIIYLNGSSAATAATYTPATAVPTSLFIASSPSTTQQVMGTVMDFVTFDRAMTATEVSADYANIARLTANTQRINSIPWLWTKDGDDSVDNANDDPARNNFAVCGGIPGSAPAETEINATPGIALNTFTEIYLSNLAANIFVPIQQTNVQYTDIGGSTDGSYSASNYRAASISTTGLDATCAAAVLGSGFVKYLLGREYVLATRIADLGSASPISLAAVITGTANVTTDYLQTSSASTPGIYITPPFVIAGLENRVYNPGDDIINFSVLLYAKRTTGSASINVDYTALLPRPFAILKTSSAGTGITLRYKGRRAHTGTPTGALNSPNIPVYGDVIELVPNRINILISFLNDVGATITRTLTYSSVYVTPRWSLL